MRRPLNCRHLSALMKRKVNVPPGLPSSGSALSSLSPTSLTLLPFFPSVTPSDSVVRRSISQQKSGVSVTIDDPVRTTRQPSPPHGKVSNIIHVTNLVGLWLGALRCKTLRECREHKVVLLVHVRSSSGSCKCFRKKVLILCLMRVAALNSGYRLT